MAYTRETIQHTFRSTSEYIRMPYRQYGSRMEDLTQLGVNGQCHPETCRWPLHDASAYLSMVALPGWLVPSKVQWVCGESIGDGGPASLPVLLSSSTR